MAPKLMLSRRRPMLRSTSAMENPDHGGLYSWFMVAKSAKWVSTGDTLTVDLWIVYGGYIKL
jgi:hypothetical protein